MNIDDILNTHMTCTEHITEPLTADVLLDAIANLNTSPIPCGYVIRANLEQSFRAQFEQPNPPTESDLRGDVNIPHGLEVFFDVNQKEDCIIFYDRALMIAYLNRWDDPRKYIEEYCRVNGIPLEK
jgi:hypothetical protein